MGPSSFVVILTSLALASGATVPNTQHQSEATSPQPPPTEPKKRAEEVLMFGNQQNKLVGNIADALAAGYFPELDKRESNSSGNNESSPVDEASHSENRVQLNSHGFVLPAALPKVRPPIPRDLTVSAAKTGFYSSFPEQWQEVYFNRYDRSKRSGGKVKRAPLVRTGYQTALSDLLRAQQNGRFKRELDLDRDDLLTLMSLLEANAAGPKYRYPIKRNIFRYGDDYDNYEEEPNPDDNEVYGWPNSEETARDEEWDDAPYGHFGMLRRSPYGPLHPIMPNVDLRPVIFSPQKRASWRNRDNNGHWGIPPTKRFMVTKKRQVRTEPTSLYSLAQLLRDNQEVEPEVPVYRRYVL